MKKEYDMILDDGKVTLSISRKKVSLNKERLDVRTASIGKKRRNSTFRIILYIIAVIAAGVLLYAALNTFLGGDVEGEPFQELDTFSRTEYRIDMMPTSWVTSRQSTSFSMVNALTPSR